MKVTVVRNGDTVGTMDASVDKDSGVLTLPTVFGYHSAIPPQEGDVYKASDGREWEHKDGQNQPRQGHGDASANQAQ